MSKIKLFEIVSPGIEVILKDINWKLCFICQENEITSNIIAPYNTPTFTEHPEKSSDFSMAKLLTNFQEINELPSFLLRRAEQYDTSELAAVFVNTKAIFHKNCLLKYSQLKYENKIKNACKEKEKDDKTPTTTRKKISAFNCTGTCFFWNSDETISNLHSCQTPELDKRVRKIALETGDVKLLGQLCEGDMIATEAKYHRNCVKEIW